MKTKNKFFIGQKVLYSGDEIVIYLGRYDRFKDLVLREWWHTLGGHHLHVCPDNLKPLPGGQL